MSKIYYEERDGRWWLAESGVEFVVQTKEPITVEGYSSLLATALALVSLS
jgi:hypothetical protein